MSRMTSDRTSEQSGARPPFVETLALALRSGRRAHGLSQRALAERAGVSKSAVARIESVQTGLSLETVAGALAAVGLRLAVVHDDGTAWTLGDLVPADAAEATDDAGRRLPAHLAYRTYWDDEPYWHWFRRYVRYVRRGGTRLPGRDPRLSYYR